MRSGCNLALFCGLMVMISGCGSNGKIAEVIKRADTVVYARRVIPKGYFVGYVFTGPRDVEEIAGAVCGDLRRGGPPSSYRYDLSANHIVVFIDTKRGKILARCVVEGNFILSVNDSPYHYAMGTMKVLGALVAQPGVKNITLEGLQEKMPYVVPEVYAEQWSLPQRNKEVPEKPEQ